LPREPADATAPVVRSSAQAIVETLVRNRVRHVFGVPGVHTYELFDALYKHSDEVTYVGSRHEQAAGYMAYGYSASTGDISVYTCVPGPGILNSGSALATAYAANFGVLTSPDQQERDMGVEQKTSDRKPDQVVRVSVHGYEVAAYIFGAGEEVLLCLNGGPGMPCDYVRDSHSRIAGDRYRVVAFDQLGCGASDRPDDDSLWTLERYVEEVEIVRSTLGLGKVHLLGQSGALGLASNMR
jgi:hypothetical protein